MVKCIKEWNTKKCQRIARNIIKVNSEWAFQFGEKMLFSMLARFMFTRRYQKQILFLCLWFYTDDDA